MSLKIATIAAVHASLASTARFERRAGPGSVMFVNSTPDPIAYALVPEAGYGDTLVGTVGASGTVTFDNSADGHGNSLKLTTDGNNPQSSSDILQFEYTYSSAEGGIVTYDWSCVNCNPDPFVQYRRRIIPLDINSTSSCQVETCEPGKDSNSCEFVTTEGYPPGTCKTNGGIVLLAQIGGSS